MEQTVVRRFPLRIGALVLAAFFWSTSFPVIRLGLADWSPLAFAFWRFMIATLLVPLVWPLGRLRFSAWKARPLWVLAGLNALGYAFQFLGQKHTLASRTALIINLYVVWIPFLQTRWLGVPLTSKQKLALLPALTGLFLLSVPFTLKLFWGDLLVLGASWVWAFYILLLKRVLERWNPLEVNGVVFVGSALVLAPLALLEGELKAPSPFGMATAAYLAVVCTWMAYGLYNWGLEATSPFLSSLVLLLEVVFAWVLSVIFLGESWGTLQILGALLLGFGLFLALEDSS